MANVETKDSQTQGVKDPFDTSVIEKELDELLRRRKLAREGRGFEEWLDTSDESMPGESTPGESTQAARQPWDKEEIAPLFSLAPQEQAPAQGADELSRKAILDRAEQISGEADGDLPAAASASRRESGGDALPTAAKEDASFEQSGSSAVRRACGAQEEADDGFDGADSAAMAAQLLEVESEAEEAQDLPQRNAQEEGPCAREEESEAGKECAPRRPAKIAQVRAFVQTRFEEQEIEQDGLPVGEGGPKFVVTLPEEVYRIGRTDEPPLQVQAPEPDDAVLTLEQYITGEIPAPAAQEPAKEGVAAREPDKAEKKSPRKLIDSRGFAQSPVTRQRGEAKPAPDALDPLFEEEPPLDFKALRAPQPHPLDAMPGKEPVKELIRRAKASAAMVKLSLALLLAQLVPLVLAFFPALRPEFLSDHQRAALIAAALLLVQLALSLEVVRGAGDEWRQRRPACCNLVLFVCLLALLQTAVDATKGAAIVTVYPALLLFGALYNRRALLKKAAADGRLVRSPQGKWVPVMLQTGDEPPLRVLVSEPRTSFEGYFTRLFALSAADRLATALFPVGAAFGALCLVLNKGAPSPLPTLTVLLCAFGAVVPFSLLRACDAPYGKLSTTLRRRGATLAGAAAADELACAHELLLTDEEFFGKQAPTIAGVKLYNGHSLEESVLVTASLAHILKLPTEHALLGMLDNRADRLMNLTEIKYLEGGGLSAFVGGTVVMLGNERFMKQNMIHVSKDDVAPAIEKSGRVPLYLACGGHMAAVFSVDYTIAPGSARMLARLTKAGIGLLLSTMDPLMTGELAEWIAVLDAGSVRTVTPREREELLQGPRQERPAAAISISDNPLAMAWSLLAASQLRTASRINAAVVALAVVAGAALCGVLLQAGAIRSLGLPGVLLFELAWTLPVWCVTAITTRIDK